MDTKRAGSGGDRHHFRITDSLFADDSTLIGWSDELETGKEVVKNAMYDYEERCHDGKEEKIDFGTIEAEKTRMLGTRIGKKEDLRARIQRGYMAWNKAWRRCRLRPRARAAPPPRRPAPER